MFLRAGATKMLIVQHGPLILVADHVRGVKIREPLKKWQFSEILSEELTEFTAVVENDKMTDLHISMPSILEK